MSPAEANTPYTPLYVNTSNVTVRCKSGAGIGRKPHVKGHAGICFRLHVTERRVPFHRCSILIEMPTRLFLGRHVGEVLAFQSLDREVGRHLRWPKGVGQQGVLLQRIQRLIEGGW